MFTRRYTDTCSLQTDYCKFGNFHEGFIFAKLRILEKIKSSRHVEISLSLTNVGNLCSSANLKRGQYVF